tara:strand:+ start:2300 stop:2926 length:627 start_codon:yes stop_codon:yes gene_type:complete
MGFPITLSLTNIFHFVSLLSPLFIIFFTIISSIVNNQLVKGLILNMGVVIVSGIIYLLKNILKTPQNKDASLFCNILPAPFTVTSQERDIVYDNPSLASGVLSFVSTYLIYPMIINKQLNPSILLFMIILVAINLAVEYQLKCAGLMSSFMGILIGMIFAMIYYTILRLNNNEDLLYFTKTLSDNTQCGKPSDKTFKCTIYKNGQPMN